MSYRVTVELTPYLEFTGSITPDDIENELFYPAIQAFATDIQIWPYNLHSEYKVTIDEENRVVDLNKLDMQGIGFELNMIEARHKDFFDRCYNELENCRLKYGIVWIYI